MILEALIGSPAPAALVELLHARTGGQPRPLLELLSRAAGERGATVERLWAAVGRHLGLRRQAPATFLREGDYWTIAYEGAVVRLRHTTGLVYLSQLLARPGQRRHSSDLVGQHHASVRVAPERARLAVTKAIGAAQRRIERVLPELGRHLRATIRRGYFCSYAPDPRWIPRWRT